MKGIQLTDIVGSQMEIKGQKGTILIIMEVGNKDDILEMEYKQVMLDSTTLPGRWKKIFFMEET